MKKYIFIIITLMTFAGCAKEPEKRDMPWISTAEKLSDTLSIHINRINNVYPPKKDEFVFVIFTRNNTLVRKYFSTYDDKEYVQARAEWLSSLLDNGLNQYGYKGLASRYSDFLYAGIAEGAKIYADRVLWGREPGEDLGDMFSIPYYYNDLIATYPDFSVLYAPGDEYPKTFREFTSNRIALTYTQGPQVFLTFAEIPPEEFDSFTLTVEIPVDVEYYKDYPPEIYEKHPYLKPPGRRILKGSRKIEFETSE
jgi:hypothetical protein